MSRTVSQLVACHCELSSHGFIRVHGGRRLDCTQGAVLPQTVGPTARGVSLKRTGQRWSRGERAYDDLLGRLGVADRIRELVSGLSP